MPSIQKITVPITIVATIVIFITGLVANYYTTISAVKDGIQEVKTETKESIEKLKGETKLELQDLHNEDKLMKKDISDLNNRADKMETAAMTFLNKTPK